MSERGQQSSHHQPIVDKDLFFSPEDSLSLTEKGMHVHKAVQAFKFIGDERHTLETREKATDHFVTACREAGFSQNGTIDLETFRQTAIILIEVQERHARRARELIAKMDRIPSSGTLQGKPQK